MSESKIPPNLVRYTTGPLLPIGIQVYACAEIDPWLDKLRGLIYCEQNSYHPDGALIRWEDRRDKIREIAVMLGMQGDKP